MSPLSRQCLRTISRSLIERVGPISTSSASRCLLALSAFPMRKIPKRSTLRLFISIKIYITFPSFYLIEGITVTFKAAEQNYIEQHISSGDTIAIDSDATMTDSPLDKSTNRERKKAGRSHHALKQRFTTPDSPFRSRLRYHRS